MCNITAREQIGLNIKGETPLRSVTRPMSKVFAVKHTYAHVDAKIIRHAQASQLDGDPCEHLLGKSRLHVLNLSIENEVVCE